MVWHDRILISVRLSLSFPHPEINADHKQYMTNSSLLYFGYSQMPLRNVLVIAIVYFYPDSLKEEYAIESYYTSTTLVLSKCIPAFASNFAVAMLGMASF